VAEVERGPRRGSAAVRAAVLAASGSAWSVPEAALLDLLATSRELPAVVADPLLVDAAGHRLPTRDVWIEDVALAVQVHSRRHHSAEDDWRATLRADTALGSAGIAVLAFTPREIAGEPARVLASVESAHRHLAARAGAPAVRAPRRRAAVTGRSWWRPWRQGRGRPGRPWAAVTDVPTHRRPAVRDPGPAAPRGAAPRGGRDGGG